MRTCDRASVSVQTPPCLRRSCRLAGGREANSNAGDPPRAQGRFPQRPLTHTAHRHTESASCNRTLGPPTTQAFSLRSGGEQGAWWVVSCGVAWCPTLQTVSLDRVPFMKWIFDFRFRVCSGCRRWALLDAITLTTTKRALGTVIGADPNGACTRCCGHRAFETPLVLRH